MSSQSIVSQSSSSASIAADGKTKGTQQSRNPVSVRLYKVLGSNFDDDATKEALQTLSDLYVTQNPSKSSERASALANEGEDVFKGVSGQNSEAVSLSESVPGESAARARKDLRRDMENKLVKGSKQFLKVFGDLDQKLGELQRNIKTMQSSCDDAEQQLRITTDTSKDLLERAGSLREERREVEAKRSIVTAFLARFTLTEEESSILTSREEPVGPRFFGVMDKTEMIRDDCTILMSGEDGPTKAGLDIVASTSSNLEQGYEKILRWCSHEFRQMDRDLHVDISPIMGEAIRRLRKRPELLTEALSFFSQSRQTALLSSFITALTRGGPSGLPRPIELHAHDPLRYIGDMLAWVHQIIAAEHELLETLFGLASDGRMVGSVRSFIAKSEEGEWIRDLMDSCVGKLCPPLKLRVQQTIRSQESTIVSYKIANLLQFYMLTMRRTIGEEALLSTTLLELTEVAYSLFYESISAQGLSVSRVQSDLNDTALTLPLPILDHVQILREIMSVYESSLLEDEDEDEQAAGFEKILDIMIDPAIEVSLSDNEEKRRLRPKWDQPVYALNCLSHLKAALEPFSFTQDKQQTIQSVIEERVSVLIEEHYENIMADAGIDSIYDICAKHDKSEPLSRVPGVQPADLQAALHNFSLWLSSDEVVQSPRLSYLTAQRLHTQIHQAALEKMAHAYRLICEEVKKQENKYEAASTLLGGERPFGQLHLLYQILGLDEDAESK